jgi:carbamoyl-phosphate synthase large subunit
MPKRTDIRKIMIIGSGPIVIGQACEFDYSGAQACKALREEGYTIVLVNSNPATIMTDPEFADRTYIEPLTVDILREIIRTERPDALLPTLGGQTGLNLALELNDKGVLFKYGVELIGAKSAVIRKAEDRRLFKECMLEIGLDVPRSGTAHSLREAHKVRDGIGAWPVIVRPAFTLGGTGGGIAHDAEAFGEIVARGLSYSPIEEVLIEESVLGWKEFELELMRDGKDNVVVVCSIENIDPMGVHTGDSVTVAPAQTLTDREYQRLRDAGIAVMRAIGVDTGGSNVQFAVNPENGRLVLIEMNPRVSRSSALASKATGFPIAKIAAKLAVGYTLDEIPNDITRETPACFEPSIDYVVTKAPRFTFEKFAGTESTLGTQMKSVGEAMAIGKTFKESLQKALRSLETGRFGFGADGRDGALAALGDEELEARLTRTHPERLLQIREAFRRGWDIEKVHALSAIDPWFLTHMAELADFEKEIAAAGSLDGLKADPALFRQVKAFGYADRQIADLLACREDAVRAARKALDIRPVYALVDTCAGEFEAYTPYYYSTWGERDEAPPTDRKKVMILGGGPNRIGQGIEFDYCCCHASYALRAIGMETIMVNSNPETVSTDYDTCDRLFFEPLTLEDVLNIYEREQCWGVIMQFGGQTPLNLARRLERNGVNVIGTSVASIEATEDRELFTRLVTRLNIRQPDNGTAKTAEEAVAIAARIGYPCLVRPSFVLGGRAMVIVYNETELCSYLDEAFEASPDHPILIDRFLEDAIEVDVDCICDGRTSVIGAIMEHVEHAGVHSGDSACIIPPVSFDADVLDALRRHTHDLARELSVIGLMNIQYALKDGEVYILEVNPRASRTIPYVSKAIGVPLAKLGALVMAGRTLQELGFTEEIRIQHHAVKEVVMPFARFPGSRFLLSPEMKSTGEVMGIDPDPGIAILKGQLAAGNPIPDGGNVFISVCDRDKEVMLPLARELDAMGYTFYATRGTATALHDNGIRANALFRISQGRPHVLDMMDAGEIGWIINTPSGTAPRRDELRMRMMGVVRNVPMTSTMRSLRAAITGLKARRELGRLNVRSIQDYHADVGWSPKAPRRSDP